MGYFSNLLVPRSVGMTSGDTGQGYFAEIAGLPGDQPPAPVADARTAEPGNDRLALNWLERQMIPDRVRGNAMEVLRGLTGDQFTDAEHNAILDQIIKNIPLDDAKTFGTINPNRRPIELDPRQYDIVTTQLERLSPDLRHRANDAFQKSRDSGEVICPLCP